MHYGRVFNSFQELYAAFNEAPAMMEPSFAPRKIKGIARDKFSPEPKPSLEKDGSGWDRNNGGRGKVLIAGDYYDDDWAEQMDKWLGKWGRSLDPEYTVTSEGPFDRWEDIGEWVATAKEPPRRRKGDK